MALCDDIMGIVGVYVETFRSNKKIHDLLNIVMTRTELEKMRRDYNQMRVVDLKEECKTRMERRNYYGYNDNGKKRKVHYIMELMSFCRDAIVKERIKALRHDFIFNSLKRFKNINDGKRYDAGELQEAVNQNLLSILDEKEKNAVDTLKKLRREGSDVNNDIINDVCYHAIRSMDRRFSVKYYNQIQQFKNQFIGIQRTKPYCEIHLCNRTKYDDDISQIGEYSLWNIYMSSKIVYGCLPSYDCIHLQNH